MRSLLLELRFCVLQPSTWAMMILGFAGLGLWPIAAGRMDQHFASPDRPL
jgi:hypothetical protein